VLIKIGLEEIPALSFAALRYMLAFICLLPLALRSGQLGRLRKASTATWLRLVSLGFLFYALTQGAQFLSLAYLPAMTISLLLSFTTILVGVLAILFLGERPTTLQWAGTALYMAGVLIFLPWRNLEGGELLGLAIAAVGVIANALSAILGRHVNRSSSLDPLAITVVSMGSGATLLLVTAVAVQGLPPLQPAHWAIIAWLAVVNSAFAYTLWNRTLRTLSAMESSIINNTMLFQIAVLAWVFLGEQFTWRKAIGMIMAAVGTLAVQIRNRGTRPGN
jgi:drug/metabolite transporter (DMT)-like permease